MKVLMTDGKKVWEIDVEGISDAELKILGMRIV